MVTGLVNDAADVDEWSGFEAVHIFPLASESLFSRYDPCVTFVPEGISKVNSPQNGLLLSDHIRTLFDQYLFSINPDVSSKPSATKTQLLTRWNRITTKLFHSSEMG